MIRPLRRVAHATAALALTAALAAAVAAPAGAGGDEPGAPPTTDETAGGQAGLELVALDRSWLAPGETANAVVRVADDAAVDVSVVVHQSIESRTEFEDVLAGESLGSVIGQVSFPIAALSAPAPGTRLVPLGVQDPAAPEDPSRLPIGDTGIYPLEVELRDADENTTSTFVLPLVVVEPGPGGTPTVGEKLRVAWVWPLVADPAILPDGKPDPDVVAELQPDGRLGRQAIALAGSPDVAVTLAPGPETLEAWGNLARGDPTLSPGNTAVLTALGTNQVLSGPYVPINIPSLLANGFTGEVGTELTRGNETINTILGTRVDPRTALTGPVDARSFAHLRDTNVDRMVVDSAALLPVDSQFTPARPVTLEDPVRGEATAVMSDRGLVDLLTSDLPPALRSQQFLAALAVIALEQPNVARGVVVANPPGWDAPAPILDATLAGLRGHPLLSPVTVDEFLGQVPTETTPDGSQLVRGLAPYSPPAPPVTPAAFLSAASRLGALQSLIGPADLRIVRGDRALRVVLSTAFEGSAGRTRAREELGVIDTAIDALLAQIRVPVGSTVTLTARKGEIPVTFLNETDQTLRVKVRLESDKLFFPDGAEREVELPPRNTTIGFTVESRASGTFPLELTVTSIDDELVIQSTRVRVRSTFVSGVGVFLTAGAAAFLAVWWLVHFRRRRRRPAPA